MSAHIPIPPRCVTAVAWREHGDVPAQIEPRAAR